MATIVSEAAADGPPASAVGESSPVVPVAAPANIVDATAELKEGKPKKRAGTVKKDAEGRARPSGDGRTARPKFDVGAFVKKWNIWRLNKGGGTYHMKDPRSGRWMVLSESQMERWLQKMGLSKGDPRTPTQECEEVLTWVQGHQQLDAVGEIPGHFPGVYHYSGKTILVTQGPVMVERKEGDWKMLREVIEGLFMYPLDGPEMPSHWQLHLKGKERDMDREKAVWKLLCREIERVDPDRGEVVTMWVLDQTPVVYTWLRLSLDLYYRRKECGGFYRGMPILRNLPVLCVAGRPDGGKSLFQDFVVKPLLGGRSADPSKYLTAKTDFNRDLFGAELMKLGDTPLSAKMEDRQILGHFLKNMVAEQWHRFHPKGYDALGDVPAIWRILFSMNDDKDNLLTMPPMIEGVVDKMILTHVNSLQMPVDTTEIENYMDFGADLMACLPAFAHWLCSEFEVPKLLKGGRWGMIAVQAPALMEEMFQDSPTGQLLHLIDAARWLVNATKVDLWAYVRSRTESEKYGEVDEQGGRCWSGGWEELKALLTEEACSVCLEAKGLFKWKRLDQLLARLKKEQPDRVSNGRKNSYRYWNVFAPGV